MPTEITQDGPAVESRRRFLGRLGVAMAALAGVSVFFSSLGRDKRSRAVNSSLQFPGEDSIFHPARDPRLDPRRNKPQ